KFRRVLFRYIIKDIDNISNRLGIDYKPEAIEKLKVFLLIKNEHYQEAIDVVEDTTDSELKLLKAYGLYQLDKVREAGQLYKTLVDLNVSSITIPELKDLY